MHSYDRLGATYSSTRRSDPRIAERIRHAVSGCASVANVGAGTGSYEPPQTVVAVEPSNVMLSQRGPDAAPAVRAVAEHLPIRSDAVDAALAVLTVHHWHDLDRGLREMARIARRRVVVLTWDHAVFRQFWLVRDYLPAAADTDAQFAIPLERFATSLGPVSIEPVLVPRDCVDGFGAAFWHRPQAYLDPLVRSGMSLLTHTDQARMEDGLARLRADVENDTWATTYGALLDQSAFDAGYRLIVADQASHLE